MNDSNDNVELVGETASEDILFIYKLKPKKKNNTIQIIDNNSG